MTVVGLPGFSTFRDWATWKKLEPGLRTAIAARDLDLAACYCDRYRMTAVSSVVTSMIREMKQSSELGISQLARIKRTWRSASRAQLSRLTAPIKYLHAAAIAFPLGALCAIAFDLALHYQDSPHSLALPESVVLSDSPILIVALSISILSSLLQHCIEARALELKRIIDDLATDMIIALVEDGGRAARPAYQAGNWMRSGETMGAAAGTS